MYPNVQMYVACYLKDGKSRVENRGQQIVECSWLLRTLASCGIPLKKPPMRSLCVLLLFMFLGHSAMGQGILRQSIGAMAASDGGSIAFIGCVGQPYHSGGSLGSSTDLFPGFVQPIVAAPAFMPTLNLQIYPNPSSGMLNIQWDRALEGGILVLLDLQGSVMKERLLSSNQSTELFLSDCPAGAYILEIRTGVQRHRRTIIKY